MPIIRLETFIKADQKIVFDLARSIDLHQISTAHTHERAIAGKTAGLIELNEWVTWEAKQKRDLMESLKAGNSTAVSFVKDGKEALLFVEANPRLRTINIKDEKGVSVRRDQLEVKDQSRSAQIAETKDQSQKAVKKQGLSV